MQKAIGAQWEAEGQNDPRRYQRPRRPAGVKSQWGEGVSAGTSGLMRDLSRCHRATGAQRAPEGPSDAPAGIRGQGRERVKSSASFCLPPLFLAGFQPCPAWLLLPSRTPGGGPDSHPVSPWGLISLIGGPWPWPKYFCEVCLLLTPPTMSCFLKGPKR